MRLLVGREIAGCCICHKPVAVPFDVRYVFGLAHGLVYYAENEVLYFRVTKVENKLITAQIQRAVGLCYHPIGVFFIEFAFGIYHLGF